MLFGKRMLQFALVCAAVPGIALAQDSGKKEGAPKGAAAASGGVTIGADAPAFSLTGTDGKTYSLADFKDKTVVLQWENEGCPVSKKMMPATKSTAEKYAKSATFLAIDSTHNRTIEADKKWVETEKLPFVVLGDFDGKIGKTYGATRTPEVFIIHKGKLVYHGALIEENGTRNYVAEALDAIAANKPVPLAETKPYGCTVKYKN